uniref:Uncharacterized protein n=1 Tax=Laticauda laticaudata TaxID=8630 RepID=A0A8C5T0P0_LATLA
MHGHQKCRSRNKNKLQGPESDVRNWEKIIVADVFASWLQSIADEVILFITPNFLCSNYEDHNTEDEKNSQPDLPDAGGMFTKRYCFGSHFNRGSKNIVGS